MGLSDAQASTHAAPAMPGPPLWFLAELTYRCPLHCVFCYNPTSLHGQGPELSTSEWIRVLSEARALGAVQCGFSGGEPLLRDDLEVLVAEARRQGFYTNLITSGVGLTQERAQALSAAGLDHVQLSFQDSTRELNDFLSHTRTFDLKQKVAGYIKAQGWPMVMNVVLHRRNIDHVGSIIEMADALGANYLELANTQYYGWALLNRDHLLPSADQLRRAEAEVQAWRARLPDQPRIFFVTSDYHEGRAKRCSDGWGRRLLMVTPDGTALPCHAARVMPHLEFPNVREVPMQAIWRGSDAFERYRGTAWMKSPCAGCEHREEDLGGCRCQAYLLTGDAAAADPACSRSPEHERVRAAVRYAEREVEGVGLQAQEAPLVFRKYVKAALPS